MIIDERLAAYINSLEQEIPEELLSLEKDALANHIPIIKKESQGVLRFLLRLQQPKCILEVGTAIGFSALFMSKYTKDECKITTIEKFAKRITEAKNNFADEKIPYGNKITLCEGEGLDILQELANKGEVYDFVFLDAAKAQYMNFLPEIMRMLSMGGMLVTDNVLQNGTVMNSRYSVTRRDRTIHARMREFLYEITHMEELETMILPVGDGLAISYRKP